MPSNHHPRPSGRSSLRKGDLDTRLALRQRLGSPRTAHGKHGPLPLHTRRPDRQLRSFNEGETRRQRPPATRPTRPVPQTDQSTRARRARPQHPSHSRSDGRQDRARHARNLPSSCLILSQTRRMSVTSSRSRASKPTNSPPFLACLLAFVSALTVVACARIEDRGCKSPSSVRVSIRRNGSGPIRNLAWGI